MDDQRFDALTCLVSSDLAARRRCGLGWASAAATLTGIFGRTQSATAHHCTYEGCGCATGTQHACGSGLVCCASSPGTPGGGGVCTPRAQCGGGCADRGASCPGYCNWGDGCSGCCSGYCGTRGACDQPPNLGLSCTGGTINPCLYGLVCCPYVPGLAGGAGVCEYRCWCRICVVLDSLVLYSGPPVLILRRIDPGKGDPVSDGHEDGAKPPGYRLMLREMAPDERPREKLKLQDQWR